MTLRLSGFAAALVFAAAGASSIAGPGARESRPEPGQAKGVPGVPPALHATVHGYTITKTIAGASDGIQRKAFDLVMAFFDKHLKHAHHTSRRSQQVLNGRTS